LLERREFILGLIFGILGVLVALGLVFYAIRPIIQKGNDQASIDNARVELEDERDALFKQIKELERDHSLGLIDDIDYPRLRLRDETRAALILERLEDLAPAPVQSSRRTPLTFVLGSLAVLAVAGALANTFVVPSLERLALRPQQAKEYENASKLKSLEAVLEVQAKANKAEIPTLLEYGQLAWEIQDYNRAANAYGEVLRQEPKNVTALARYGQILFFASAQDPKLLDQSLALLRAATKLTPPSSEAWMTIGNILFSSKNDPRGALDAWKEYQKITGDTGSPRITQLMAAARKRLTASDPAVQLFSTSCAGCHGSEAQGQIGPNLRTSVNARDAAFVSNQIKFGSKNKKMPGLPQLSVKDIGLLVKYVTALKP
jgi:cytochrome c-type biogenesis protein CcmH/NrfG